MADMQRSIEYRFQMVDNVSQVAARGKESQVELKGAINQTTAAMTQQTMEFIANVMALSALEGGINALVSSFTELEIVNEKQAGTMRDVAAAVKIFVGAAQMMQGIIGIVKLLRNAEIGLAAVQTYRKVLNNPAAMAAVLLGMGAAGAALGYFIGKGGGGGNTTNQTINFNAPGSAADQRAVARDTLENTGAF